MHGETREVLPENRKKRFFIPPEFDGQLIHEAVASRLSRETAELDLQREKGSFQPRAIERGYERLRAMLELLEFRKQPIGARTTRSTLDRIQARDAFLGREELALLGLDILDFLEIQALSHQPQMQVLRNDSMDLQALHAMATMLGRCFDESLQFKNTASVRLAEIRSEIEALKVQIRRDIQQQIEAQDIAPLLQEEYFIELNGRLVLLVRTDRRSACKGIAHGTSNSGQTTFMEPQVLVAANNRHEELVQEEAREIARILSRLNSEALQHWESISGVVKELRRLDVLRAKALFSRSYQGCEPRFEKDGQTEVQGFFHPFVKGCVPNSFLMGRHQRIMILSGPNAGGKTVTMKSIALLYYFAALGLPAPANSAVLVPIDKILYLMGDYQSLMDSMSSFAAHLSRWKRVLKSATENSLLIADEIMNATDPREGEALASEMLLYLGRTGMRALVSTHYNDVKNLALEEDTFVNASMVFDSQTLAPSFQFVVGTPGSSYGLELFEHFGLPADVLQGARERLGTRHFELKGLLEDEKKQLKRVKGLREKAHRHLDIMRRLREELEGVLQRFERDREKTLEKAYSRVLLQNEKFRKQWDERFRNLLREEPEQEKKQEIRERFRIDYQARAKEQQARLQKLLPSQKVSLGDTVFLKEYGKQAVVEEIRSRGTRAKVRMNGVLLEVDLSSVLTEGFTLQKPRQGGYQFERSEDTDELDLRGLERNEALYELEMFLDRCLVKGLSSVSLIHGKGVLKQSVLEFLKRQPGLEEAHLKSLNEGSTAVVWE